MSATTTTQPAAPKERVLDPIADGAALALPAQHGCDTTGAEVLVDKTKTER